MMDTYDGFLYYTTLLNIVVALLQKANFLNIKEIERACFWFILKV